MLIFVCSATVLADTSPPSQVLSNYENSTGSDIVRDCGYSTQLPANPRDSLWLFCDTAVDGFNPAGQWGLTSFITGSTAAEGPSTPGEVPAGLSEVNTPGSGTTPLPNSGAPAHFLPAPAGLVTSAGLPCDSADNAYPASWISGVTRDPARPGDVLISFNNYCVMGSLSFLAEGSGLAEYNPAANTVNSDATVFSSTDATALASPYLLGSPVVSGRYLYLFGSFCNEVFDVTCITNSGNYIYLARVRANPSGWANPAGYQWYAGPSTWTADPASAVSLISGATPLQLNVGNFSALGRGLVMVEQTNAVGAFTVYQAPQPAGPWTQTTTGTVPCTTVGENFCRAIIPHPELSTSGDLLLSFFNPAAAPFYNPTEPAQGHVMVAAFPW